MGISSRGAVERQTRTWLHDALVGDLGQAQPRRLWDADGQPTGLTRQHFGYLQRKLAVFRWLERLGFDSFMDVASGWEHYPYLVRTRYQADTYYSDLVHEMNLPKDGALLGKRDHAVTLNLGSLPFRDQAFDVVLCSEVLEHLVRPVEAISELLRITRKCLIMTSLEALSTSRFERWLAHVNIDVRVPHVERNFLLLDEFHAIFGDDLRSECLQHPATLPATPFHPPAWQDAAYAGLRDRAALEEALVRAVSQVAHDTGGMGILLVKCLPGVEPAPPVPGVERELARWLLDQDLLVQRHVEEMVAIGELLRQQPELLPADYLPRDMPVAPALAALLRCPDCRRGALVPDARGVRCTDCGTGFEAEFGVPVLYPRDPDGAVSPAECLERLCGADPRRRRTVERVMRRLRRNETAPGPLRRLAWRLTSVLGTRAAG